MPLSNYPYTNLHEMNLDWIIPIIKEFEEHYTGIDAALNHAISAITEKENATISDLNDLQTAIESALNQTKQEDIAAINAATAAGIQQLQDFLNSLPSDVQDIITQLQALNNDFTEINSKKLPWPITDNVPDHGENGQALRTKGDGTTEWADIGQPTDEQTENAVSAWLSDHPEATTTVQDGSLTLAKFSDNLKKETVNHYVTPQMFGALADGEHDDTSAIQYAVDNYDTVFFPAGQYKVTDTINLHNNSTLFGTGRESKIINVVHTGTEKTIIMSGNIQVGNSASSFLNLTAYSCTIDSDRYTILINDTSAFSIGDIVYICKDEAYTTKNPLYSWNGKITDIVENTSIKLDAYIGMNELLNANCLIRNMNDIPSISINDHILENVCVHDLSLIQSIDDGSGMYCLAIGCYKGNFYNIWTHGNTSIGSNYAVYCTFDSITAEFDGGFCDIPEISQYLNILNCRGSRYGNRLNTVGFSLQAGFKCFIKSNFIDFGGIGKIGSYHHLQPVFSENSFLNLGSNVELSKYGHSIFINNIISGINTPLLTVEGIGNIITQNTFDNPNSVRWLGSWLNINYGENCFDNNYTSDMRTTDAYYGTFINSHISSDLPIGPIGLNAASYLAASASMDLASISYPIQCRLLKLTLITTSSNYQLNIEWQNGNTRQYTMQNTSKLEMYFGINGSYIPYLVNGDSGGKYTPNLVGDVVINIKKVSITNTSNNTMQVCLFTLEELKK